MKTILVIALFCAGGGAGLNGARAEAQPSRDPVVTESVSSADLNLRLAADQQRLKARISFAAYRLCLVDSSASPSPAIADPQCHRAAMASAVEQMDRLVAHAASGPALAALAIPVRR